MSGSGSFASSSICAHHDGTEDDDHHDDHDATAGLLSVRRIGYGDGIRVGGAGHESLLHDYARQKQEDLISMSAAPRARSSCGVIRAASSLRPSLTRHS